MSLLVNDSFAGRPAAALILHRATCNKLTTCSELTWRQILHACYSDPVTARPSGAGRRACP